MPKLSDKSIEKLDTCHPDIIAVMNEAIKYLDFSVTCGIRGEEAQTVAFREKKSKVEWPNSKHNKSPSQALDIAPYPIDFNDSNRMIYFAGALMMLAKLMKEGRIKDASQISHEFRWGGDWDSDTQLKDQLFNDLWHFEIIE